MSMNNLQEKLQQALYLERYAGGHSRECPMAIPELRSNVFTKCICGRLQERSKEEALPKANA